MWSRVASISESIIHLLITLASSLSSSPRFFPQAPGNLRGLAFWGLDMLPLFPSLQDTARNLAGMYTCALTK